MTTQASVRKVVAQRGPTLRCKGWRQEGVLRMLENTLENGEDPDNLVIYASSAQAARNWSAYTQIVHALTTMTETQTLVVQSGKPVGLFETTIDAPVALIANANVVERWANREGFRQLQERGLTMYGGMTAGAWQYIGSQGILQGTYETLMEAGRQDLGAADLRGKFIVTAGLGGMGGAQPLAGVLAGGSILVAEVDGSRIDRRIAEGYLQVRCDSVATAVHSCLEARDAERALSVGVLANAADVMAALLEMDVTPDIVTDQTTTDFLSGYIPQGMTPADAAALRRDNPDELRERAKRTMAAHVNGMLELRRRGATVFEYGNGLREQAKDAGVASAPTLPIFTERYIRPLFCRGIGPFRWVALSGEAQDIFKIDALIESTWPDAAISNWIRKAAPVVQFTGLPARIGWLGHGERTRLALLVNEAVRQGNLAGPVAFTRDHLDAGSVTSPHRETENMLDGSDGISDWPLLNALLHAAGHADVVAVHSHFGQSQSAGVTVIADGSEAAAARIRIVITNDTALGVLRYADAGYDAARAAAAAAGLGLRE